jgi:hypothetical protein
MTGAPAQTWRKFTFSSAPNLSRRASGCLPLTRASRRRVALASWIPASLITAAFVMMIVAAVVGAASSSSSGHRSGALVYTNWVKDANSSSGPHPGYKPALTGLTSGDIQSANAALDQNGISWVVNVTFTSRGADAFDRLTKANVAACPIDSTSGTTCPQRYLAIWLGLTQPDIDNWDDTSYQAKLLVPYDEACQASATVVCGKLVMDALTLEEISGGLAQISGNFTQKGAHDFVDAIQVSTTPTNSVGTAAAWGLAALGLLAAVAGLVGALTLRRIIGPRATVMEQQAGYNDRLVELRNVHPAFVAAVRNMQQARAAQHTVMFPPQNPPPHLPPPSGSN